MAAVLQQFDEVGIIWPTPVSAARSLPGPALVGSRIAVITSFADGGATSSVSSIVDDGGTLYTLCKRQPNGTFGMVLEMWSGIASSINAGQGVIVTQSAAGTSSADDMIALYEIGDPDPDQVFDAINTNGANTASVTSHDSGNVTPDTTDSVIIGMSRGSDRAWTPDPDFINNLDNSRTTLGYRQQAAIADVSYTVTSDISGFAGLIIVAFDASSSLTAPVIDNVDTDDTITSTQENWPINGSLFDNATVEIRQDSVEIAQTVNSGQTDTQIICNTVFDPGAPGNGPHLKYGAALLAVINFDLQEDTHAITIAVPVGRSYVDIVTPNETADNRITAVPDIAAGDQLEISNVVGGTIADVTVNDDATFDCAASVVQFQVRCWDASDQTWGNPGIQTPGSAPIDAGGVTGPGVEGPTGVIGLSVEGPRGVTG